MIKTFTTDRAAQIIEGDQTCEWIHLNIGLDVPPVSAGSYKYLLWDIINARKEKDLLISRYFQKSFDVAKGSDCAVCQLDITSHDMRTIFDCRFNWLKCKITGKENDIFLQSVANIIRESQGKNVLLWGGINSLPELRKHLPEYNIAYAQRHYNYRREVSYYDYCDTLLAQTPGQVRYAFEKNERVTPSIYIIPNGVETEIFHPVSSQEEKAAGRAKLGIPQESTLVVFPSKVALHKGSRLLERLILKAENELSDVCFLVIGGLHHRLPASHRKYLEKILTSSANTYWSRGVNRDAMPDLIRLGDICLMPAVWREGFSMAGLECMSSGLPVVAPASGSYTELIKDGYNGKLARVEHMFEDLYEAIKLYALNRELCQKMGVNCRKFVVEKLKREKVIRNFCLFLEGNADNIENDMSVT
ncbi:MAG: glycosyltransferase [Candidatus Electrothrix sp. AW3_4]|nr:glycosyltransferase [Candidatus Electrothrix gigas]